MIPQRSKDSYQKQVYDFIKVVLVICPSCDKKAIVDTIALSPNNQESEIKVTCTACGFNKRLEEKPGAVLVSSSPKKIPGQFLIIGGFIDPYFHLPLWLTTSCCDNTLWAYNEEHLDFLKEHIETKLRERNTQEMSNRSLGSRLPQWMTSKKNRERVLKSIAHLKRKT